MDKNTQTSVKQKISFEEFQQTQIQDIRNLKRQIDKEIRIKGAPSQTSNKKLEEIANSLRRAGIIDINNNLQKPYV